MMFKGTRSVPQVLGSPSVGSIDDTTARYGVGAWHLVNGRRNEAIEIFRGIISGPSWPAFGSIAAEAELARSSAGVKGVRPDAIGTTPRLIRQREDRGFASLSPSHPENADSPFPEP